jgi:hypothetical protein
MGGSGGNSGDDAGSASGAPSNGGSVSSGGSASDAGPEPEPHGIFVAVGYGGRTLRSTDDGVSWVDDASLVANGGDDDKLLRAVVWGSGKFVALGWRVMTSADGKTFDDHGTTLGQWIGAATYAHGDFVAVGGYGLHRTSTDGLTWDHHDTGTVAFHAHDALAFGDYQGGRFLACGDDGARSYSTDGKTWTASTGQSGAHSTHAAFGNGIFIGIDGQQVVVSHDGGESFVAGGTLPGAPSVGGIVFAQAHFTVIADGHAFTSPDGATWTDHAVSGLRGGAIAYGHGTYVLVGGGLRRSPDGITFAAAPDNTKTGNGLEAIAFGPTG